MTALEDVKRYEEAAWSLTSNFGADWGEWKFLEGQCAKLVEKQVDRIEAVRIMASN